MVYATFGVNHIHQKLDKTREKTGARITDKTYRSSYMLCLNRKDEDENMEQLELISRDKGGGGLPRTRINK